ncbi:hypothetical protein EVAR_34732_1 [Eumeta japonica]|uniref:Uncharacterized protein n=1 Tax=Eumeta variegata TaxID=151549 RepID=A0A4C1XH07_EUMVA|nr:hypothetical protein EVAR_34732_1 [Eumeta japonica]
MQCGPVHFSGEDAGNTRSRSTHLGAEYAVVVYGSEKCGLRDRGRPFGELGVTDSELRHHNRAYSSFLASARGFARLDFEQIPLSYVSAVYDLNPNPDLIPICLTFDFDRSPAFNSEPDLGLSRLGLRSPALISDLGTVPTSDSEHVLGSNFNSALDSNHGSVLDSVVIREVICEIWYTGYHRWHVSMVVLGFFFLSPLQEWMSDIWIRRQRFGSAQCAIAEAASARNISSNIFSCTAYCRGFITDERPRTNIAELDIKCNDLTDQRDRLQTLVNEMNGCREHHEHSLLQIQTLQAELHSNRLQKDKLQHEMDMHKVDETVLLNTEWYCTVWHVESL